MLRLGYEVDLLRVEEGGGQFPGQTRGIKLLLRRIEERKVVGQILMGQIRTRRGRASLHLDSFVVIKRTLPLELMTELL